MLSKEISYKDAIYLLEDLVDKDFIKQKDAAIISTALTDKALSNPIKMEGILRANILKSFLTNILKT